LCNKLTQSSTSQAALNICLLLLLLLLLPQVMQLLVQIYTEQHLTCRQHSQSTAAEAADPAGVRQLLLGCAELLRPAANASVEWRCAALGLMSNAVGNFMDSCPGESA
jgi:hypothetical protein